jgi:hypothetical protein
MNSKSERQAANMFELANLFMRMGVLKASTGIYSAYANSFLRDGRNRISGLQKYAGELFVRYLEALAQDLDLHFITQV